MEKKPKLSRRDFLKDSALVGGSFAMLGGRQSSPGGHIKGDAPRTRSLEPSLLRCEYAVNPLGIDVLRPRFSWKLESTERGRMQSAYQILVASSEQKLKAEIGDKWDSGKVQSDQSIHIPYGGSGL